ncbi:LCP family protein [Streptomyces gobiensis]|uniref:LCP family protein n=1 Tax=Streptomyces gobiensis TaxID=2875706 RepID=UPI001E32EFA6|nr:LCP family protein [Streptomyces gobiensis]UGY91774.1 LCP family protein [Streptomyces gobiensis]
MRQRTIDGGGEQRIPDASELGWVDGLYENRPPRQRGVGDAPDDAPDDDGHKAATGGGRKGGGGPRPRRKRRVLRWIAAVLALLILGTAGAGYLYYRHLNGNLTKDVLHLGENKLDKSTPNAAGQTPLNILLMGSDSRNSKENVRLGGAKADEGRPPLADVQMLVHVSADRSNMSVVSIPRDTRVTIPKCTDPKDGKVYAQRSDKINTSLQNGGPGCTVATWEELTGIPIDHFMMVDFSGVVSMADAVGGVPVCVNNNVYDRRSGLRLEKGENVVKGEQALQWLRTRHGFEDGSDLGRAKAQHMYMNSMVRELKAGSKLTNPNKLRKLAEEATKALTVDDGLGSVGELYDLGEDIKRVPTKRITMATMPWVYSQGGSYVLPKEGDAEKVFSMVRNDVALDGKDKKKAQPTQSPEPSDPAAPHAQIAVRVLNGTGTAAQAPVTGRAAVITDQLRRAGFSRAVADRTPKSQWDTTLTYPSADLRGDALAVAKTLGIPERSVKHFAGDSQITVVVGADWREGAVHPKQADSGDTDRDDGKAPESLDGLNGDDKTACMDANPNYTW